MTENRKDQLFGGLITLVVGFLGLLLWSWWSSPSDQAGIILATDNQFIERTNAVDSKSGNKVAEAEMYAWTYEFNNLQGELKNFSIIIPVKAAGNAPILIETQQSNALIKSVSNASETQMLGRVKVDIQSLDKGGEIVVRMKSPSQMREPTLEGARSDAKSIRILIPSTLHIYL